MNKTKVISWIKYNLTKEDFLFIHKDINECIKILKNELTEKNLKFDCSDEDWERKKDGIKFNYKNYEVRHKKLSNMALLVSYSNEIDNIYIEIDTPDVEKLVK